MSEGLFHYGKNWLAGIPRGSRRRTDEHRFTDYMQRWGPPVADRPFRLLEVLHLDTPQSCRLLQKRAGVLDEPLRRIDASGQVLKLALV